MSWIGDVPFKDLGMTEDLVALLKELAEDNDYWKNASSFIHQVKDRKLSSLSDRQRNWIVDIVATLAVELNKRAAKDMFGPSERKMTDTDIKSIIDGRSYRSKQ